MPAAAVDRATVVGHVALAGRVAAAAQEPPRGRRARRRRRSWCWRRSSGPPIIEWTTGYTYDYIPRDAALDPRDAAVHGARRIVLVDAPDGHRQRRPRHPRARAARRPHLADGRAHLDAGVARHRHRRTARRPATWAAGSTKLMMRDRRRAVRAALHDDRHRAAGVVRRPVAARPAGPALHRARRRLVADDGAHRPRAR